MIGNPDKFRVNSLYVTHKLRIYNNEIETTKSVNLLGAEIGVEIDYQLTLSWRRPLSYRNRSIDLLCKSMDWCLYDNRLRHERVKLNEYISALCYEAAMQLNALSELQRYTGKTEKML